MASYNKLVVSAPAKVILHGEHSVVYGKVALAASLGLRTTLTWEKSSKDEVELLLNDLGFFSSWTLSQLEHLPSFPKAGMLNLVKSSEGRNAAKVIQFESYVKLLWIKLHFDHLLVKGDNRSPGSISSTSVEVFKQFLCDHEKGLPDVSFAAVLTFLCLYKAIYGKTGRFFPGKFVVKSNIPVGAGLGSSASFSVVVAAGLLLSSGLVSPECISKCHTQCDSNEKAVHDTLELINKWAFEGEKIIHGNPSGIDNTVSTFGGFLQFQNGKMKNLSSIPELNIFLVNTNIQRSTKAMVGGLKDRYREMPALYESLFVVIGEIVVECVQVLGQLSDRTGSSLQEYERSCLFQKLEKLIDLNQGVLRTVGVSHRMIDKVCEKTLDYGLHSKLTGAGGGGCVITLINEAANSDTLRELCEELKNLGCDSWKTKLGGAGVFLDEWS